MTQPLALIIEDEPDLAFLFAEAMRIAGFQTEIARRGDTALRRLAEIIPCVVVLDLWLPGVDGITILHYIRIERRLADTRVIVVTADAERAQTLDLDADLTLLKPVSIVQLCDLARRLLPEPVDE